MRSELTCGFLADYGAARKLSTLTLADQEKATLQQNLTKAEEQVAKLSEELQNSTPVAPVKVPENADWVSLTINPTPANARGWTGRGKADR